MQSKIRGKTCKKGHDALINKWEYGMNLDDASISIVCRVFKALDEVVRDSNRGPLYAAKILFGSDKKNLINVISSIAQTAKANRDEAYGNIDLSVKAVKNARTAYNNRPKFDLGGKKNELFQGLLNAIRNDMVRRCEYERYKYLCEALDTAKTQLLALYKEFFAKYADVILDLKKVFEANKLAIAELQDVSSDPFMLPLFKISEVRNTLDAEVDKLGIDTAIEEFNDAFYQDAYEIWHTGNEDKISKWINNYMSEAFRQYIELSLDDHIRNLYPDLAEDKDVSPLVKRVREDIIQKLNAMAAELFLLDGAKAPRVQNHTDTLTYCSAPMTAPIINRAIEEYPWNNAGISYVSSRKDRILVMKSSPCVPMFAYGLIDICYKKYIGAISVPGKHLYEGASANGDSRNWQILLPDLRPYSIYQHIDWTLPEKNAMVEAYKVAEYEAGIIHSEVDSVGNATGSYYIWRTPNYMPQIDAAKQLVETAQKLVDTVFTKETGTSLFEKHKAILSQLTAERDNLKSYVEGLVDYKLTYGYDAVNNNQKLIKPEVPPIEIRNDGDQSVEATAFNVRRDYVLSSPMLMQILKDELEKVNAYNSVMKMIESIVVDLYDRIQTFIPPVPHHTICKRIEQPIFINALLSGVITYSKRHAVTFEDKDEFGIENNPDIELSKPASKPFGGIAPLYQAFNTYCDLPKETRNIIHAKVDQRLNGVDEKDLPKDWTETMQAAYDSLVEIFIPEHVQSVAMGAKALPEYSDIMSLYKDFLSAFRKFRVCYL